MPARTLRFTRVRPDLINFFENAVNVDLLNARNRMYEKYGIDPHDPNRNPNADWSLTFDEELRLKNHDLTITIEWKEGQVPGHPHVTTQMLARQLESQMREIMVRQYYFQQTGVAEASPFRQR